MELYDANEYRATDDWKFEISAGCIVYRVRDTVEVLLLKRDPEHEYSTTDYPTYHLPKGHVGFAETLDHAALRETKEEAGCTAILKTYLGPLQKEFTHPAHRTHIDKTIHYFAAEWQSNLPGIDMEHNDKLWVPIDEAEGKLGPPNPKGEDEIVRRLKDALELMSV